MAKFVYKFESMMNVKEILEKKIQEQISRYNKEIEEYKLQLKYVSEEQLKIQRQMIEKTLKVSEFQSVKMYDSHLDKKIKMINRQIENLLRMREDKQTELVEKKKERKVLEALKENQYESYLIEEKQKELKEMNEIAIRKFGGNEE